MTKADAILDPSATLRTPPTLCVKLSASMVFAKMKRSVLRDIQLESAYNGEDPFVKKDSNVSINILTKNMVLLPKKEQQKKQNLSKERDLHQMKAPPTTKVPEPMIQEPDPQTPMVIFYTNECSQ